MERLVALLDNRPGAKKYNLGKKRYFRQRLPEAEELFRRSVEEREQALGERHVDTLESKDWLARTLSLQQKYPEAEALCQQVERGREKVLGKEHRDTFSRKEHKDTVRSKILLQKLMDFDSSPDFVETAEIAQGRLSALSPQGTGFRAPYTASNANEISSIPDIVFPLSIIQSTTEVAQGRLGALFQQGTGRRAPYTDSEIYEISSILKMVNPRWSTIPRTYIVLRTINCLDILDSFVDLGFSDYWFPVTERSLPHCLRPSYRSKFVDAQDLVLTKSIDLEKGQMGQHCHFRRGEPLPFETKGTLGSGGFGQVDKVLSSISFREYARKQVPRAAMFGGRRTEAMNQFIAEIQILKRLEHIHIVDFVGSYTDPRYMGLIMSPVADMDLSTYLARIEAVKTPDLRTFLGCLVTALEYLHSQNIRHKDIKPQNILVKQGKVLFTDFGLSLDFTDADGSTTVSMANGMTPKYCAPEVMLHEPRNTSSDIWSLGVVFLEMVVVLKGLKVEYMYEFLKEHGSQGHFVRTNPTALQELLAELEEKPDLCDNRPIAWVQQMLSVDQQSRPTASALVVSITASTNPIFCGICCRFPDDDFSDTSDELDDFTVR
ncbi:kinase-like protein [Lophium mytilinum]|uniref:Kinase-like protein n=1 Tax=Lophium mytilinum TaxID=390894 RepID=A0A6A6R7K5_9PEZI|nr:kinase-like protein [Lophium mytilinum]